MLGRLGVDNKYTPRMSERVSNITALRVVINGGGLVNGEYREVFINTGLDLGVPEFRIPHQCSPDLAARRIGELNQPVRDAMQMLWELQAGPATPLFSTIRLVSSAADGRPFAMLHLGITRMSTGMVTSWDDQYHEVLEAVQQMTGLKFKNRHSQVKFGNINPPDWSPTRDIVQEQINLLLRDWFLGVTG